MVHMGIAQSASTMLRQAHGISCIADDVHGVCQHCFPCNLSSSHIRHSKSACSGVQPNKIQQAHNFWMSGSEGVPILWVSFHPAILSGQRVPLVNLCTELYKS